MSNENEAPWWHWSVVPGQAWRQHYIRHVRSAADKYRAELDGRQSPDPRYVDPPKYPD